MSQQLTIRFKNRQHESEFESNLLAKAYALLEGVKDDLGVQNFLAMPFTSNEEALYEEIEQDLGGEPEDYTKFPAFEEQMEKELCERGDFFGAGDLLASIETFLEHFSERAAETFDMDGRHTTTGGDMATELKNLCDTLRDAGKAAARFVIG